MLLEDDNAQFKNPDFKGGANKPSLIQVQQSFIEFVANDLLFIYLVRKPIEQDEKDLMWKL